MSSFPRSPRLLRGGIVLIDPDTSAVKRIIVLQYNADTISRTTASASDRRVGRSFRGAALEKGPPVETIKLDAELDVTDPTGVSRPAAKPRRSPTRFAPVPRGARNDHLSHQHAVAFQ